jgi:hypothetical protein
VQAVGRGQTAVRYLARYQTVEIGPSADLFLFRFLIIFLRQRGK